VLEGGHRVDQRGIEPRAAALAGHGAGGGRPALLPEDLHGLGQADDARERRDGLAREARGIPVAVPVLVELVDGAGGVLVEVDRARDVRAALAAHGAELARAVDAHGHERAQVAGPRAQRRAGRDRAAQVAQRLGGALGIDEPALALDVQLVGAEDLGRRGRRGRAAGVLEQQRVEERRAPLRVEVGGVGQAQADEAAALGVAHGLALGHVEGVRQGADDLRQADVHQTTAVSREVRWGSHDSTAAKAVASRRLPAS
jgi:hypothetical protein